MPAKKTAKKAAKKAASTDVDVTESADVDVAALDPGKLNAAMKSPTSSDLNPAF